MLAELTEAVPAKPFPPDVLLGEWTTADSRQRISIEPKPGGGQNWRNRDPGEKNGLLGQIIAETARTYNDGDWLFRGRHKWANGGSPETWPWGGDGQLVVAPINEDTLFYAYLDSRYKGGWLLKRVSP
jgi:hypothetical protein